jgi:hypothetical protein
MQNGNQKMVDRQCKKVMRRRWTGNAKRIKKQPIVVKILDRKLKIALHEPHELVCSGSLCSPSTIDTHLDTVKTTRTSYDMEFVLDTTKTDQHM